MNQHTAAENGSLPDLHMTGKRGIVCDRDSVSDNHIMTDMDKRHQQHMIADRRLQEFKRRPVNRHIFPDHGIRTDFRIRLDSLVKSVILRLRPDKGAEIDPAARADCGILPDFDMGINKTVIADSHIIVNDGIRSDLYIFPDLRIRRHDSGWMDCHRSSFPLLFSCLLI